MEKQKTGHGTSLVSPVRLDFVDAAKGLGILAVIWGHMDYLWSTSSVWFSSFKLAVFYVVVGLLKSQHYEKHRQLDRCGMVLKKRVYSLIIPYGVYSLLAIFVNMFFAVREHGDVVWRLKDDVFSTLTLRGVSTLWFLPTLLFAELLFSLIEPERRSRLEKLLLCVLVPLFLCAAGCINEHIEPPESYGLRLEYNLFLVTAKSVSGCWFMLCGYYAYRRIDLNRRSRPVILAVLLMINFGLSLLSPNLDFNYFLLGRFRPLFYINGFLGSVAVLELLRYLEGWAVLRPLIRCGKNSMFLMTTHMTWHIAPSLIDKGKSFYTAVEADGKYFMIMLVEFAALMAIEAAMICCKDRIKNVILGGREKKILSRVIKYL